VTAAIRFSRGYVRTRMLKARLWTALDRPMLLRGGIDPDGRPLKSAPADVYPPLVGWYVALMRAYPSARSVFRALLRLHEIENVKLLWRAAVRRRALATECWRPLEPLGVIAGDPWSGSPEDLIERLVHTPFGSITRALLRSGSVDLPAAELGLDRWALSGLLDETLALPGSEIAARRLLSSVIRERDLDVLRRGVSLGLDPDIVAKSTIVMSRETTIAVLTEAVRWEPTSGQLWRVLPPNVARITGEAADWDAALEALRRARLRACRRAFLDWPYQLAPAIAALLLREEQARATMSIAAAANAPAGLTVLSRALAAGLLGA
jgi:hypothetical protein